MPDQANDAGTAFAQQSSNLWTRFKAFANGVMDYLGIGKEKETPEPLPEYCHLGCEPNDLARQYKYAVKEKLGMTKRYSELEPSPSEAQEKLRFDDSEHVSSP